MRRHTSSPQPQAVERKNKHPSDESKSNLSGSKHRGGNKNTKSTIKSSQVKIP